MSFVLPFDISLPSWVTVGAKDEQRNFVAWDGANNTALRVMHPVKVCSPAGVLLDVPADFVGFLRSQSRVGVHLEDVEQVKAGPYPATLLTMTSSVGVDGGFGCPEKGMIASDCFGAQPELALRMAVPNPRCAAADWLRTDAGVGALKADSASFTTMITGLRFPARAVTAIPSASTTPSKCGGGGHDSSAGTGGRYIDAGIRLPMLTVKGRGVDVSKEPWNWPPTARDYRGPGPLEDVEGQADPQRNCGPEKHQSRASCAARGCWGACGQRPTAPKPRAGPRRSEKEGPP